MNQQMYRNAATQANLSDPAERGGLQLWGRILAAACGDVGPGRMLDPGTAGTLLPAARRRTALKAGVRLLLTAGRPAKAPDPVRHISNQPGKMGYAIARAAREAGARYPWRAARRH